VVRALLLAWVVALLSVAVHASAASSTPPAGTILYILDPQQRSELFSVETSAPFSRRDLRIGGVVDAAYATGGAAIYVLKRPRGSQTVEVIRMRLDGSHRQILRAGLPNSMSFAVAPDGKSIALLSSRGAILMVKLGVASKARTVVSDTAGHWIAWSGDGRTLYYTGGSRTPTGRCWSGVADLCAFDLRTDRERTVGPLPPHVHANIDQADLSLSADGRRIAFSTVAGPAGIAVIGTDGSDFHRVVVGPNVFSPAWSPNGDSIAYRVDLRGIVVTNLQQRTTRTIASFIGSDYPRLVGWNESR
jgi:Tol biopolymer transport system component